MNIFEALKTKNKYVNESILQEYIDFIYTSKNNSTYYERHHIIPRSLGGDDKHSNLIQLTRYEHIIAHYLLAKAYCYSSYSMNCALSYMTELDIKNIPNMTNGEMQQIALIKNEYAEMKKLILEKVDGSGEIYCAKNKLEFEQYLNDGWGSFKTTPVNILESFTLNGKYYPKGECKHVPMYFFRHNRDKMESIYKNTIQCKILKDISFTYENKTYEYIAGNYRLKKSIFEYLVVNNYHIVACTTGYAVVQALDDFDYKDDFYEKDSTVFLPVKDVKYLKEKGLVKGHMANSIVAYPIRDITIENVTYYKNKSIRISTIIYHAYSSIFRHGSHGLTSVIAKMDFEYEGIFYNKGDNIAIPLEFLNNNRHLVEGVMSGRSIHWIKTSATIDGVLYKGSTNISIKTSIAEQYPHIFFKTGRKYHHLVSESFTCKENNTYIEKGTKIRPCPEFIEKYKEYLVEL